MHLIQRIFKSRNSGPQSETELIVMVEYNVWPEGIKILRITVELILFLA